jgi:hypothetical protein
MTSNLKELLPEEKIEVSYKLVHSNDINKNGFPYEALKINVSDNLHKFNTPEHQAHQALLKLYAITKDSASKNPTAVSEINKNFFPSQKESFFVYPVQHEHFFEKGPVKKAKQLLGFTTNENYQDIKSSLEQNHKVALQETTEKVNKQKEENNNLIKSNDGSIDKKTADKNTKDGDLTNKVDEKKQIVEELEKLNMQATALRVSIRNKKEGNVPLDSAQIEEKNKKFDEIMTQIKQKKKGKIELEKIIHKLDTEIMILERDIRDLVRSNERLEIKNDELDKEIKHIDESRDLLMEFIQNMETQKGGYQPRRSRRQSKMRGGSRKKTKRYKKNKSRRTTI